MREYLLYAHAAKVSSGFTRFCARAQMPRYTTRTRQAAATMTRWRTAPARQRRRHASDAMPPRPTLCASLPPPLIE